MKGLKITVVCAVTLLLIAFVHANTRYVSPAMSQEPVSLGFYKLDGLPVHDLANRIEQIPGVSACAVSDRDGSIGVTYRYNEISEASLRSSLAQLAGNRVYPQDFGDAGPQCPFSMMNGWWEKMMLALRVV